MRRLGIPVLVFSLCACYGTVPSAKTKDGDAQAASAYGDSGMAGGTTAGNSNKGTSPGDGGQRPPGVVQMPPKPVVADCGSLPAAGEFESILPEGVTKNFAFAVDPVNLGTVYLGTDGEKIWKTTDCGATWKHINTGKNGAEISGGMNWTFIVDPINPEVLYTNSGYNNSTNGAFRSKNGGVDWDLIWPPADGTFADLVNNDFANVFALDPTDHNHLLLTFHSICNPPYAESCIAETFNGGDTWQIVNGNPEMVGTEGQIIYFLENSQTWLWASQEGGFWRTEDGGETWAQMSNALRQAHPQGTQLHRAKDGTFYVATWDGVARSADGKSWALIDGTGPLAGGLVSDGTTMYMSNSFYWGSGTDLHPYFSAPESTGAPWKQMITKQGFTAGGTLGIDVEHRLLYSSNLANGFWRIVLP